MKSFCGILFATLCALSGSPAGAAITLVEGVEYLEGVAPPAVACSWEPEMVSSTVQNSRLMIAPTGKPQASSGLTLALQVAQLKLSRGSRKSEYEVAVRAKLVSDGRLLITREFKNDESFASDQSGCEALRALGKSLGEDIGNWVAQTRFVLPTWTSMELIESVEPVPDAAIKTCNWKSSLLASAAVHPKLPRTTAGTPSANSGLMLALQVIELKLSRGSRKSEFVAVVRANVVSDGKLLATRDFRNTDSFTNDKPACDTLLALGKALGEDVANWASETRFMSCRDDCAGIHPEETIVVGAEVLLASDEPIDPKLSTECHWSSTMVNRLVKVYNDEAEPPPRAKLESRPIDIEKYPGRRLVLRLTGVRATGGGGFSGPKWLNMSGELWDGPSMVANFESHANSLTGLTTCRVIQGLSDRTVKIITEWLSVPTLGAKLQ